MRRSPYTLFLSLAAAVTLGSALLVRSLGGPWVLAYLVGVNAGTFLLYGYDKYASSRAMLRVPERVLHVLAFAGGTPAAFAAQQLLRHKTVKRKFRVLFWVLTSLQAAGIAWWASTWR